MKKALGLLLVCLAAPLFADSIATRDDLQTLIGGRGYFEGFPNLDLIARSSPWECGGCYLYFANTLDSTTMIDEFDIGAFYGPGLVIPQLSFSVPVADGSEFLGGFQWELPGFYDAPSDELLAGPAPNPGLVDAGYDGSPIPLTIHFLAPSNAFGIDLRAFAGHGATATVSVYGTDGSTLIDTLSGIALGDDGAPVFVGAVEDSNIGELVLSQTNWSWSPTVTNIEFGSAQVTTPEPGTLFLLGGGLLAVARRLKKRS